MASSEWKSATGSGRVVRLLRPEMFLASYQIGMLLGTGATARVYEGTHRTLGRKAAIKVLHPHLATDRHSVSRFLREGRTLSRVVHPNVVEVFDVGEADGTLFLIMSLVGGEDLRERIRRGPMSANEAAHCLLPIVSAVHAIHHAGVVHRDLKPSNIRFDRDYRGNEVPKVLDFGISKCVSEESGAESTGPAAVLGTTAYMSPEQLRSAADVDARSDVYALGVILYECVTGQRPFAGATPYELMHAILTEPVMPPSARRDSIPSAFDAVVLRALQRDPSSRYGSASEFGQALIAFSTNPASWIAEFSEVPSEPRNIETARESRPSLTLVSASRLVSQHPHPASCRRFAVIGTFALATLWALLVATTSRSARPASPKRTGSPVAAIVAAQPATTSTNVPVDAFHDVTSRDRRSDGR